MGVPGAGPARVNDYVTGSSLANLLLSRSTVCLSSFRTAVMPSPILRILRVQPPSGSGWGDIRQALASARNGGIRRDAEMRDAEMRLA
ncbi:hypothetical protein OpiT1DRAFT_05065 [Opitutaceae bacterium TAV1]|nr:hypothetical protein OPIT5_23985 [Opitutaceae bacterium TAV5]EIQ00520.1 hypothetical protein OpiT1DRAFT_05065 [Opitutaceae bacterium TAV1]